MHRLNRAFAMLMILAASSLPAFAEFDAFLQAFPAFAWTSAAPLSDIDSLGPDEYRRYYAMPSPLVFGIDLEERGLELLLRVDTRADFLAFQTELCNTNVPFIQNGAAAIKDVNMPTVAYLDYEGDGLRASVGRRKLAWGPATYDLAISDDAAYLDNLWFDYRFPSGRGDWWFNYVLIGIDRSGNSSEGASDSERKTIVAHRLGYENERFRIGVGELNLIYGTIPDIADIAPLVSYHNLYENYYSNVMMTATAEALAGDFAATASFSWTTTCCPGRPRPSILRPWAGSTASSGGS